MSTRSLAPLLLLLALSAGCKPDYAKVGDDMIRRELKGMDQVEAVQFFEEGGRYYDDPSDPELPKLDQHILKLVREIRDDLKLAPFVTVDPKKPQQGHRIIVMIPESSTVRTRLEQTVDRADATFPGDVFPQWGHDYLVLEFYDQEDEDWFTEVEAQDE